MNSLLGCACLQIDYTLPSWMSLLPAFESSFHPCDTLGEVYYHQVCFRVTFDLNARSPKSILDSSIEDKPLTGNQLIKIIKDNELDGGPLVIHVIGSDGAMVYSRIAGIMNDYINGAILETLPSPDQAVGAQVRQ